MRLTCPRCGAQYEIDAAAIPPAGRDVECSACDHVWRASPQTEGTVPFDPTARPRLSRPLSESVIEILREEAARELEVRAAERRSQRLAEAGLAEAASDDAAVATASPAPPSPEDTLLPGDAPETEARVNAAPESVAAAQAPAPHEASAATVAAPAAHARQAFQPDFHPAAPRNVAAQAAVRRRRYDAGFHLAVVLSLTALALYALAPRLADQQPFGPTLVEWRGKVDDARDRLARHGDTVIAKLRAVIDSPTAD